MVLTKEVIEEHFTMDSVWRNVQPSQFCSQNFSGRISPSWNYALSCWTHTEGFPRKPVSETEVRDNSHTDMLHASCNVLAMQKKSLQSLLKVEASSTLCNALCNLSRNNLGHCKQCYTVQCYTETSCKKASNSACQTFC